MSDQERTAAFERMARQFAENSDKIDTLRVDLDAAEKRFVELRAELAAAETREAGLRAAALQARRIIAGQESGHPYSWDPTIIEACEVLDAALAASPGAERAAAVERVVEAAIRWTRVRRGQPGTQLMDYWEENQRLRQAVATLEALDGGGR